MSEAFKVGERVEVTGKEVQGTVAFIGLTNFATGKWIGLVLDVPKGKNNGTVQGKQYFKCEDNFGMFVRAVQLAHLDEHGKPIETPTEEPTPSSKLRSRQSAVGTKPKPTTVRRKTSPTKRPGSLSASSRQSLASSRQSLAGSRQSLAGSRSQLTSPNVDRPEALADIAQNPKRASFVETNFVETLKPQFTPGQAITSTTTPVTTVEEKLNNLQFQQELENRSQQIKDLGEKLETLRIKRQDDKEKMKDYDKLKIQLEQLIEFKTRIMESQASLQRDLQRAKLDAKEAIEAREAHAEEVSDLAEAVEMATLDKEMAEEKAETLQLELEVCKEKLEEVTLDLEILKTEMQNKGSTNTADGAVMSTYEIKQLEQQNARLRETLVRMRDLSAHDKHEYQKLMKDMDQKKSEVAELGRTKEKLSSRVEEMEQQIADLQEQVDAAMGAEEMVVILGEQKLSLEEKVVQLQEEVSELEALQDMNDQLVESNAELEMDLREELDMAHSAYRESLREKEAAMETIADREATINKFRELVQKLQDQSLDLQHRLEKESSKPVSALPEILDFKKMFTETKAHTKAIDLELRRVDVQQLQQHIKYLTAFMPDTFMNRGGDHDAVLILLLVPRLVYKTELLISQIRDKFPAVEKIDTAAVFKGHAVEQFAFRCRLSYHIFALQTILHQYYYALNSCKPEALLKVGGTYPEMGAQEKVIDGFVELVKRDQLDENVPTEILEKCVGYFNTMYPVLLSTENKLNHTQLLNDTVKMLVAACDGINNDALVIRTLIETSNVGDIGLLAQYVITTMEQVQQQLKLVKRRIPPDTNVSNLGLNKEVFENIYQCYQQAGKIMKTLQDIVKVSVQTISTSGDSDKGLSQDKIKDIAINASDKVYEQDDLGPVQSIKNSIAFILMQITQLAQFLQDNEYEINTANKNEEKPSPPVMVRAQTVKKELEQTKTLTSKLENKESDIKELKKTIKEKQEQLSEMTIRKELAEKKLGNVNKDYELTIEKLQRKLDEARNSLKKNEKEFEETMDHLQADIDSLENERSELKERLKHVNKKGYSDPSKSVSASQMPSLQSSGPSLPAVVKDSPLLLHEIDNLRKLFNNERNERMRLEGDEMKKIMDGMKPLPTFKNTHDPILDALHKEGAALKQEILMNLAKPRFPPIYKVQPGNGPAAWQKHFAEERDRMMALKRRADDFQSKVTAEAVRRKFGGSIETDFTIFPTIEMTKALKETSSTNIGYVKVPKQYLVAGQKPGIVNLELDFQNLQKILLSLAC
ncbi:PREDICTED: dynactin subunit 1 isoform X2 [Nicrophorus vespilloides]|uniref:Dynactin subunit 1 n=1 Tax=Nicrophorus vespilloides TaxID=110193 RepID=A0ABM1NC52_NICVS|nr:PREDICTED: dynactin subunit 1 isoform X2 [Nicrophorus vespilloides]